MIDSKDRIKTIYRLNLTALTSSRCYNLTYFLLFFENNTNILPVRKLENI